MCIYHDDCDCAIKALVFVKDIIGWSHDSKISYSVKPNKSRPGALKTQPTPNR